ncbi:MAG: dephospho-CoA kinase [Desulfobulbaceae bacterium]|nr:dephospho-CoA kinase [Desulfobulbaceae bacterium]
MSTIDRLPSSRLKPVGLTGGIGSGKSSVARYCARRFGLEIIDADRVCRHLLDPGGGGYEPFISSFGRDYLAADGGIDRQRLRLDIFRDHKLRQRLNDFMHPLARHEIENMVARAVEPRRCLVEVPLLYEAGWENDFSAVVVVYATDSRCLARLMQRDQLSRDQAADAIAAQLPLKEKALRADHVIDNSGCWQDTCLQILHLGKILWAAEG